MINFCPLGAPITTLKALDNVFLKPTCLAIQHVPFSTAAAMGSVPALTATWVTARTRAIQKTGCRSDTDGPDKSTETPSLRRSGRTRAIK